MNLYKEMVITRSRWNARKPRSTQHRPISYWKGIRVHHSAGPTSQTVRQIQDFHMDTNGWPDIGYNFLVRNGRVYYGRGWTTHPAHDGINETLGICVVGNYMSGLPSTVDLVALAWFIREARRRTGKKLSVTGHRDASGSATACPGDKLYRWVKDKKYEGGDMPDLIAKAVWNRKWNDPVDEIQRSYSAILRSIRKSTAVLDEQAASLVANQAAILARIEGKDDGETKEIVRAELDRMREASAAQFAEHMAGT
ncbi:MAG: N-acetylmuramoyl-L-alanine amidase, partial [Stackebrandtia sp.]